MSKTTKDDDTMPSTFPKKWAKVLKGMPDFQETADAASIEDLKKTIVTAEGNVSTIEKALSEDVKINAAKEIIKDLSAPYRDALKCQMAKIKYAIFLLEGKGVDVGDVDTDDDED
jgi:hypothetical protein